MKLNIKKGPVFCSLLLLVLVFTFTSAKGKAKLVTKTIKEAKNCDRRAKAGDNLRVHYVGRLDDEEGKIFDSSRDRGKTFNFKLGAGQVFLIILIY